MKGGKEVGLDEAGEGFGEEVVDLGWVSPVGSFEGLDGLDCFDAENSAFHEGPTVVPWAAPYRSVAGGGDGLDWLFDG